jgi:hypothetical protein
MENEQIKEYIQGLITALKFANDELSNLRLVELEQNQFIAKLQGEIAQLKGLDK